MRKILVIILVVMLTFSVFAVSACNKGNDQGNTQESSSSSVDEEATKTKRSRKPAEQSSDSLPSTSTSSVTSSTSAGSSTSGNNGQVASGEAVTISVPSAPSDASMNVNRYLMSLNSINSQDVSDYPSYTAYLDEIARLLSQCDTAYSSLTPAEKAISEVVQAKQNSDQVKASLQSLKDDAVASDFEAIYTDLAALSALKNENVTAVYSLNDMIKTSEAKLSSRVSDYSAKKTKVAEWMAYIASHSTERAYIANDMNNDGILSAEEQENNEERNTHTTDVDNFFTLERSGEDSRSPGIMYSDKRNPTPSEVRSVILGDISFTADLPGTLKLNVYGIGRRVRVAYDASGFGEEVTADENKIIFTSDVIEQNTLIEIKIPRSGKVTVWTLHPTEEVYEGDSLGIFSVSFSYPELP